MRLVDADKIEPHEQLESLGNGQYEYVRVAYMDDIDDMPTVDAVPVRHGRWIMAEGELAFWDECSECGKKILHRTPYYDFCPNCGADMRKGGEQHGTK